LCRYCNSEKGRKMTDLLIWCAAIAVIIFIAGWAALFIAYAREESDIHARQMKSRGDDGR